MSMNTPSSFLYEQRDGIATITLNRPERLNAITFEVYRELTDLIAGLRDEKEVRAVVITGAGGSTVDTRDDWPGQRAHVVNKFAGQPREFQKAGSVAALQFADDIAHVAA